MGLLDNWNSPEGIGLLSAIAGGLATARRGAPLNSLGAAGLSGLMGYANAQDRQQQQQQNAVANELRNLQLAQAKKAAEQEATISALAKNHMLTPEQQAISQFGPTQTGADAIGAFKPKFDLTGFVQSMYGVDPIKAASLQQALAKETPFDKVNPKDFTPASISKFAVSRNYSDLIPADKQTTATQLEKLIAARDALPEGHPSRKLFDQAINKETNFAPPITVQNFPNPVSVIGPDGKPTLAQFGNKGDVRMTGMTPAPDAKPPTEFESKAGFYANNMAAAEKTLSKLESEGLDMSRLWSQAETGAAGSLVGNIIASPRAQQARQAQNQWAEQMLRMQTGAAATQPEIDRTVKTYFPQPGDKPETVSLKRDMRAQAQQGVFAASGRAQSRVDVPTVRKYNPETGRIE